MVVAEGQQTMPLTIKRTLAAIVLMLSLAAPVKAGQFEDAQTAWGRRDYATSLLLIRPLAEQGNASAQNNLGVHYATGKGVPQDYVSAHMWFNLSAAQSTEGAAANRYQMEKKMTPAQIAEAQKLAREWKPTTQQAR